MPASKAVKKKEQTAPQAAPPHNVWGSQEREDRGRARYSEYCNDLGAAVFAIADLETALASALRAIKTVEIAMLPVASDELYVVGRFPGYAEKHLNEADKLLRPLAQQVQSMMGAPEQLSIAIHEAVLEIQEPSEGIWKETALGGI